MMRACVVGGFSKFVDCKGRGRRWDLWVGRRGEAKLGLACADWGCLAARRWFLAGGEAGEFGCLFRDWRFWMGTKGAGRRSKGGDARAQTPGRSLRKKMRSFAVFEW